MRRTSERNAGKETPGTRREGVGKRSPARTAGDPELVRGRSESSGVLGVAFAGARLRFSFHVIVGEAALSHPRE